MVIKSDRQTGFRPCLCVCLSLANSKGSLFSTPPGRPSAVPSGSIAHAKMSGSSFWGTVVKPGKTGTPLRTKASQLTMVLKQVRPPSRTGQPCRVPCSSRFCAPVQAALVPEGKPNGEPSVLSVQVGAQATKFVLCHLAPGKCEQWAMDLGFSADEEVTFFLTGKNQVHLTGFFEDDEEDDEGDFGDEDDSQDEDEEDEAPPAQPTGKAAKPAAAKKPSLVLDEAEEEEGDSEEEGEEEEGEEEEDDEESEEAAAVEVAEEAEAADEEGGEEKDDYEEAAVEAGEEESEDGEEEEGEEEEQGGEEDA